MITASWCVGLFVNKLRDNHLSFIYESKEERLKDSERSLTAKTVPIPVSAQSFPSGLSLWDFEAFLK